MSAEALYKEMGLRGYEVLRSWEEDGALCVEVAARRAALTCKTCGCRRVHVHERRERWWQAPPFGVKLLWIMMKSPRVKCLECGSKTWHQPTFAVGQRRVTKQCEKTVAAWLPRMTIQDVGQMFALSWNTVSQIDLLRLRKLPRPKLSTLRRLALDENYLGKKHKFITVVLDLDTHAIVAVVKGRGAAAVKQVVTRIKKARAKIASVATDMAGGYIAAVQKYLPDARLVFDHFHVIKLMNEKLTALRRELYNALTNDARRHVLKGVRWLLLSNPENLKQTDTIDERARLDQALQLNRPLAIAYYLKDDLRKFWWQKSEKAAAKFLNAWCRRATASGIRQLKTMAKTLQKYRRGLLNWYQDPISTGPLEGINNKIGALQRRAYGYRNYEHFAERLLTLHHTKSRLCG